MPSITKLLLLPKFDNSSSRFKIRDLPGDYELMTSLLLSEWEYPIEPFQCLSSVQIWNLMFPASLWLEIYRFSNRSFSKYLVLFTDFRQFTVSLLVWVRHCKKQFKPSLFDKNSRTMHKIQHKSHSMIQSAGIKNWFP